MGDVISWEFVDSWRDLDRSKVIEVRRHPWRRSRFCVTAAGMGWPEPHHWSNLKTFDEAWRLALKVRDESPDAEIADCTADAEDEYWQHLGLLPTQGDAA